MQPKQSSLRIASSFFSSISPSSSQFSSIPSESIMPPFSPFASSLQMIGSKMAEGTIRSRRLSGSSLLFLACFLFCFASFASGCSQCEHRAFEEYKKARQEQILKDLLKKLELSSKPNVTVDLDSLRYIAPRNPRIQALIDQSRREKANDHRRVRKSIQQWRRRSGNSGEDGSAAGNAGHYEEDGDYFPSLYETEQDQPAQTSYILAQGAPQWFDQELPAALFKFSADLRKKFVTAARLNVFLRRPEQFGYGPLATRLNVYQRYPNGTLGPKLISKHLDLNFDETTAYEQVELQLDTIMVQEWIETGLQFEEPPATSSAGVDGGEEEEDSNGEQMIEPEEMAQDGPSTVALYVEAMHEGENLVQFPANARGGNNGEDEEQPTTSADALMFFELELVNLKSGRSRRNSNVCRPGANHTKCCLYDLVIDFEKIGWGFVIAPKRYNAYVCSGECTGLGVGSQMGRAQAAAAAKIDHFQCCHPKEYSGITILFVQENNNVLIREVPNMVAKDCGCT